MRINGLNRGKNLLSALRSGAEDYQCDLEHRMASTRTRFMILFVSLPDVAFELLRVVYPLCAVLATSTESHDFD